METITEYNAEGGYFTCESNKVKALKEFAEEKGLHYIKETIYIEADNGLMHVFYRKTIDQITGDAIAKAFDEKKE